MIPKRFFEDFPCCGECLISMMCLDIRTFKNVPYHSNISLVDITPKKPCIEFKRIVKEKLNRNIPNGSTRVLTYYFSEKDRTGWFVP